MSSDAKVKIVLRDLLLLFIFVAIIDTATRLSDATITAGATIAAHGFYFGQSAAETKLGKEKPEAAGKSETGEEEQKK